MSQTTFRVTREAALALADVRGFDLGDFTTVKLPEPWLHPHASTSARYRIRLKNGEDPSEIFPETPGQSIRTIDAQTIELTVRARAANSQAPHSSESDAASSDPPTSVDLASSDLVPLDAPEIRALAQKVGDSARSRWKQAVATERLVHDWIERKDYATAFASADEVARTRTGDCTEHAVLLTALCRAQGIPARSLYGLVYAPSEQGFAFHMWNEVWVDDRWISLDATLGRGGTGAAHLVLGHSRLTSESAMTDLLPVIRVMGQLEMELLEFATQ